MSIWWGARVCDLQLLAAPSGISRVTLIPTVVRDVPLVALDIACVNRRWASAWCPSVAEVRVPRMRFSVVISRAFAIVAAAALAIGSVLLFSENMITSRELIASAAIIASPGMVNRTVAACLPFGFSQVRTGLLQIRTSFPSQFVLMLPFLPTIAGDGSQ